MTSEALPSSAIFALPGHQDCAVREIPLPLRRAFSHAFEQETVTDPPATGSDLLRGFVVALLVEAVGSLCFFGLWRLGELLR